MRQPAISLVLLGISPLVGSVPFTVMAESRVACASEAPPAEPQPASIASAQHAAAAAVTSRRPRLMMALDALPASGMWIMVTAFRSGSGRRVPHTMRVVAMAAHGVRSAPWRMVG